MTDTHVSYAPGSWTLLARAGRYLLVDATPADPPISLLWSALESATDLDGVLATLADELPDADFCLVETGDELQLAQRGIAAALDGRTIEAGPTPGPLAVPDSGGVIIAAPSSGAGDLQIPIEGGVVGAGALIVVQVGAAPRPEPEPDGPSGEFASLLTGIPDDTEPEPEADEVAPAPDKAANTQIWADVPELDQAVAAAEPVELAGPVALADSPLSSVAASIQAPPPAPGTAASAMPTSGALTGETVLAGICLNGHLSGANAPTCRVCGSPMPAQTPRTVARPSLGFLVLQDGTTIDLDRGAILGRAPHVPDDATERPHLVNLAAYGRDVSRQHAEVIVRGWSVFVRDLGSANGTRVHDPIGRITALQPGVSIPLLPGSTIDIAEVTAIQYRTM